MSSTRHANEPHVIYGVFFCGNLVYIGCTWNMQQRIVNLLHTFKPLKRHKKKMEIKEFAEASCKREGERVETRLMIRELRSGNRFLVNGTPSVSLEYMSRDAKSLFRRHWRQCGSNPYTPIRRRGGGNWTIKRFDAVAKTILSQITK